MKQQMMALLGALLVQSLVAQAATAGEIIFHPERAIYAGNGCPQGSTQISIDEFGDLYIDHSALAILLHANGERNDLSARRSCTIRVPVNVPKGLYVKSIEQRIHYGALKSAGAEIQVATRAAFSGDNVSPFNVLLPRGEEIYSEFIMDSRLDRLDSRRQKERYCRDDRVEETMFQLNVVLSGQRDSIAEDLVAASYGNHFGEGFEIELGECPQSEVTPVIEN